MDEPLRVDQRDRLADHVRGHAGVLDRKPQQPPDADPGRAGPDEDDSGRGEIPSRGPEARQDPRHDDRGRPRDVVV